MLARCRLRTPSVAQLLEPVAAAVAKPFAEAVKALNTYQETYRCACQGHAAALSAAPVSAPPSIVAPTPVFAQDVTYLPPPLRHLPRHRRLPPHPHPAYFDGLPQRTYLDGTSAMSSKMAR